MGEDGAQQVKVAGQQLHRSVAVGLSSPATHLLGRRTQSESVQANQYWHVDTVLCNLKENLSYERILGQHCPIELSAREMSYICMVHMKCLVHLRN